MAIMQIELSWVGDIPVFHLNGRLDAVTAPCLEERLLPLGQHVGQKMIFHCKDLSYISSAGLRVFLTAQRHHADSGGGVAFSALSRPVADLFALAGLEGLFVIEDSDERAAARLSAKD